MELQLSVFFNFALVAFILWHFGRKPIAEHFRLRSEKLEESIRGSERESAEVTRTLQEWEAKWAGAQQEVGGLSRDAQANLARYREATLAAAKAEVERIGKEAVSLGDTELRRAKENLGRELALRSVRATERFLKGHLEERDKEALVSAFAEKA